MEYHHGAAPSPIASNSSDCSSRSLAAASLTCSEADSGRRTDRGGSTGGRRARWRRPTSASCAAQSSICPWNSGRSGGCRTGRARRHATCRSRRVRGIRGSCAAARRETLRCGLDCQRRVSCDGIRARPQPSRRTPASYWASGSRAVYLPVLAVERPVALLRAIGILHIDRRSHLRSSARVREGYPGHRRKRARVTAAPNLTGASTRRAGFSMRGFAMDALPRPCRWKRHRARDDRSSARRRRRRGSGMCFSGEAGIGKSCLWDWTVRRAVARGIRVLGATDPAEAVGTLAFVGLAICSRANSTACSPACPARRRGRSRSRFSGASSATRRATCAPFRSGV